MTAWLPSTTDLRALDLDVAVGRRVFEALSAARAASICYAYPAESPRPRTAASLRSSRRTSAPWLRRDLRVSAGSRLRPSATEPPRCSSLLGISHVTAALLVSTEYPRPAAAAVLVSPRNIHVSAALLVATIYPRPSRGGVYPS
mmetsp:Transcript_33292/g.100349  ORF Transcript_33292/g.100349 Transcript_33292/m.100349 type:complete len:144 (-) Transcript_33292:75-506(-)